MKLPHNGQKRLAEFFAVPERRKYLLDFNRLVTSSGPAQKYVIRRPLHAEGACCFCMAIANRHDPSETRWFAALPEHDPEKWQPVFEKDHAPTKNLDLDPIQLDQGLELRYSIHTERFDDGHRFHGIRGRTRHHLRRDHPAVFPQRD
ncbi:MAG: hypothetical protein WCD52_15490 [Xanthobacteraceae bacterium]